MKPDSTIYTGVRRQAGDVVKVDGKPLRTRNDLRNHSPDGFAWGYGGSGPSQLSLAILADFTGDDARALRAYQDFKWELVAKLPQGANFVLVGENVRMILQGIESRREA